MTVWYLNNTAQTVTDGDATANTPTGAGNFANQSTGIGTLSTTHTATPTNATLTLSNGQLRGMLFVTAAGEPAFSTAPFGGWTFMLKVASLSGVGTVAVLGQCRVVRLDEDGEIIEIGEESQSFTINMAADSQIPRLIEQDIAPYQFGTSGGAWASTDRIGLQLWLQDVGAQTSTTFNLEVDTAATYLADQVLFQTIESFDNLSALSTSNQGATCNTGGGNPTCGMTLTNVKTPQAGGLLVNSADGGWGHNGYTVVAGWNGDGHALEAPNTVTCFKQNTETADTWVVGFRFKTSGFGAYQQVVTIGSAAGSRTLSVDISTAAKFEVWRDGGNPGTGTQLAVSNETLAAATWVHIELAVHKHITLGSFEVRVNGVPLTWGTGGGSSVNTGTAQPGVTWNSTLATIDDAYIYSGNTSGYRTVDHLATAGRLPRFSTLLPVSQGSQQDFDRYDGTTGGNWVLTGGGTSNNFDYVNDPANDTPLTMLRSITTGSQDSWIMDALDPAAGEVIAFITSYTCAGHASEPPNSHEIWLGGTAFQIDDLGAYQDLTYESLNAAAQFHNTARHWNERPDGSGPWDVTDFAALEIGVGTLSTLDFYIGQARAMVLWYEPQAAPAEGDLYTLPILGVGW